MPIDPVGLIIFLVIGAIAGWLAGQIMRGGSFGLLGNIIIGVLGAILAGWLFAGVVPLPAPLSQIVTATIGAIILLFLLRLARR